MNCNTQELPKKEIAAIKHLWEKLNQIHYQDSVYFKDHFKTFTFEKRCNDFSDINDEEIKINVLIDSEKVVGYCIATIKKAVGEIESIYVDDEYRKKGFGKKLIEEKERFIAANKEKMNQMDSDLKESNALKDQLQEELTKLEKQLLSVDNEREKMKLKM